MDPVKKTVIAVAAVAALAGAGPTTPQIVDAANSGGPTSRHTEPEPGDDNGGGLERDDQGRDNGADSPRDRAEVKDANGRHIEPGDDRGGEVEPADDDGDEVEPGEVDGDEVEPGDDDNGDDGEDGGDDDGGHGGDDDGGHDSDD